MRGHLAALVTPPVDEEQAVVNVLTEVALGVSHDARPVGVGAFLSRVVTALRSSLGTLLLDRQGRHSGRTGAPRQRPDQTWPSHRQARP
jgi:hypothetical protein